MKHRKKYKNLKVKDILKICRTYCNCDLCPLHHFTCMAVLDYKLDEVVEYDIRR